jgi:hypothetical protein
MHHFSVRQIRLQEMSPQESDLVSDDSLALGAAIDVELFDARTDAKAAQMAPGERRRSRGQARRLRENGRLGMGGWGPGLPAG